MKKLLFLNSVFFSSFLIYSLMRIDDDSLNVFLLPKKKEKKMGGKGGLLLFSWAAMIEAR